MAENKKDSFTFSDKIKNSKPAFNPFSKRVASKIGSNGKPKKTLFERTKRDAPFFIAALAALLMLPFLYKYSGSVGEGAAIIPPGSESSVFDPERFGFEPSAEDPNGQIAQLTGRDPLSMIKGWGSDEAEAEDSYEDFRIQDGLDDNYNVPPAASSPRSYAPAATRAAFQRQATKINELGSASMATRGGGGGGFGRFGGANLKNAAQQDSAGAPKEGIKPVALQPLRAADNPARSYFGQTGASQARASRDALTKANAAQGLKDALFTPAKSGAFGGLGSGEFAPGGGGGEIRHTLDYKGITPWWWDMMKERSQEAWRWKYFLWRKNLVEPLVKALAEVLATFGKGLACCVLTGEDDCSMGSMWGTSEASFQPGECDCGKAGSGSFSDVQKLHAFLYGDAPMGDKPKLDKLCKSKEAQDRGCTYKEPKGGGGNLGFFAKRAYCLGATVGGNNKSGVSMMQDRYNCEALDTSHNFSFQTQGDANKWYKYHAVIAKNYVPFDNDGSHYLCGGGDRNINRQIAVGVNSIPLGQTSRAAQATEQNWQGVRDKGQYNEGLVRDDVNDACVIYVAEGPTLDWDAFKSHTMTLLEQMKLRNESGYVSGEDAFNALHLYFVEGYAFKHQMAKGSNKVDNQNKTVKVRGMPVDELPLKYADFEEYYVLHRGNTVKDKESYSSTERHFGVSNQTDPTGAYIGADGKHRTTMTGNGKVDAVRGFCAFSTFRITADAIDSLESISSVLAFNPQIHGKTAGNIVVTLEIPEMGWSGLPLVAGEVSGTNDAARRPYVFKPTPEQQQEMLRKGMITAKWKAQFQHKLSTDDATYGIGEVIVKQLEVPIGCEPGTVDVFKSGECVWQRTCQQQRIWSVYELMTPDCIKAATPNFNFAEESDVIIPVVVGFFDEIGDIPDNRDDLLNPNIRSKRQQPTTRAFGPCETMGGIADVYLKYMDPETEALLAQAKSIYDAANEGRSVLAYSLDKISVGNLVDAITIVQGDVQLNTACMLGKTIGAASQDGKNGNNMFGAFAAYMGEDSSFFPALYKKVNGEEKPDLRFLGCSGGSEVNNNKAYHYGHYNWNHIKLGDQKSASNQYDREYFEQELEKGPWKGAPLKDIAQAVGFKRAEAWQSSWGKYGPTDSMDLHNRKAYHSAYENIFQKEGSCQLSGATSYANVMAYIDGLCTIGPRAKPTNGDKLSCQQRYKADKTNAPSQVKDSSK